MHALLSLIHYIYPPYYHCNLTYYTEYYLTFLYKNKYLKVQLAILESISYLALTRDCASLCVYFESPLAESYQEILMKLNNTI